ncbi:MAG TPA: fumarylacetoacetate hydrolase family protein [Pyrinomonadaceae bacterium]
MKICRFTKTDSSQTQYGLLEQHAVSPLIAQNPFNDRLEAGGDKIPLHEVKLLAPVVPTKIVCVGRNYLEHAVELGNKLPSEPLLFLKPPSSIIADGEAIVLPSISNQVEHEGELGVVIGRMARAIGEHENPLDYVLGYTCLNDVTARDLQRKDIQFTRAKSFDTFCPVGPFIETEFDPLDALVSARLNGQIKQQARTSAMAFSVPFIIRYISLIMTLYPGDLIATGTPAGVSSLKAGDEIEIEIEGVGLLKNSVAAGGTALRRVESVDFPLDSTAA